jgi:hypothetical protein
LSVLTAFTVKLVVAPGVEHEVLIVSVDVFELSVGPKDTGFGENEALAPVGNAVVMLRLAENAPGDPGTIPLFTVIV